MRGRIPCQYPTVFEPAMPGHCRAVWVSFRPRPPSTDDRHRLPLCSSPIHIWYIEMNHIVAKHTPITAPAVMVTQANG